MKRVLVISNIEWSTENAFGNTISNWFDGMKDFTFSSLYSRSSMPHNSVCRNYYSITTSDIIKHALCPNRIGNKFCGNYSDEVLVSNSAIREKRLINVIHKYNSNLIRFVDASIFKTGIWKNKKFFKYLDDFKPDIVFSFISGAPKSSLLVKTVLNRFPDAKYIGFIADDILVEASKKKEKTVSVLVHKADLLYGASKPLSEKYELLYNKEIKTLTKGCHIIKYNETSSYNPNKIIDIVYAGNLYYGRDEVLGELSNAIEEFNIANNQKFRLKIFSGSQLPERLEQILHKNKSTTFGGKRSFQDIKKELKKADIVLHVESFNPEWEKIVRYSFSTKIIDCLESGSALLMIGPKSVASIQAASDIKGSFVITDIAQLSKHLYDISKIDLGEHSKLIRKSAKELYDIDLIQRRLSSDIESLFSK